MPWDSQLWNDATMARELMHLGAVVLKPASKPPVGFTLTPPAAPDTVPSGPGQ